MSEFVAEAVAALAGNDHALRGCSRRSLHGAATPLSIHIVNPSAENGSRSGPQGLTPAFCCDRLADARPSQSNKRSASEAEQAVRWAKFWPRGERGLNGGNRDGRFGLTPLPEYMAAANASTFIGIQIETAGALAGAAAIAAIPDVDLLFIGPSDLSQVLGVPGDFENSRCLEVIETIARTCAEANKPWGVFSRGPGYAERMRDLGCRLFVLASDIDTVHAGIRSAKARYEVFFPGR